MKTLTVAFFGHRDITPYREVEATLYGIVEKMIREEEYVEFLVGRNGDFDQMTASVILRAKKRLESPNNSLILVLPYMTAEYRDNSESFLRYYDEVEICPEASQAHFKQAIIARNRYMVKRADIVVCYVERETGGAFAAMRFAEQENKRVINLA